MMVQYTCANCGLRFALGTCDGVVGDEFNILGFRIYLVCTNCGTQHALETADSFADNRLPAMDDRLLGWPGPALSREIADNNDPGELHVQGERRGPQKAFFFEQQLCGHCGVAGTLIADLAPDDQTCPYCKNQTLREDFRLVT